MPMPTPTNISRPRPRPAATSSSRPSPGSAVVHPCEDSLEQAVFRVESGDGEALFQAHGLRPARPQGLEVDPRQLATTPPRLAPHAMDAAEAALLAKPAAKKRPEPHGQPVCDRDLSKAELARVSGRSICSLLGWGSSPVRHTRSRRCPTPGSAPPPQLTTPSRPVPRGRPATSRRPTPQGLARRGPPRSSG